MTELLEKYYLNSGILPDEFRMDLQLFAAEDEGRTEEPTEKKIREAREKGQVAKTMEYPQAVVVLAGCLIIFVFSSWMFDSLALIIKYYYSSFSKISFSERNIKIELLKLILESGKLLLPVFIAANMGAIIAEISQVGFQISTHPLKLDWSKIKFDPATMMKKIFFSRQVGVNLVKTILKIVVIGFVSYLIIANDFEEILKTPDISIALAMKNVAFMGLKIVIWSAVLLLVISVPDYFFQKLEFMESLKMTKQEIKEEFKETMGDPHVRARMREMQRDILMRNMIREVPKADVVVTNPTHFAVALKYDRLVMEAPTVIAKGADSMALKIREIARENSVEIIENRPLAQEMYKRLEVGDVIPEDLFRAVSFIYAELYKRENRVKRAI
ncbi:MAG TPA: flagellar biosynthesis protein FlhB [Spirochaetota bacterium]|nr:flagellar biosynthesis protein FlhB [Spirochaetota bacterium]HPJ41828.1 flagellar biosynthesis protein FlhB [Spirochaetota bacterium]HPR36795.1 flagellar biosynthesis protein FlhB [Spirochaetota bacterium]HRX46334.1 flagellar biosynthesis protein FlhB [Spirochaetota bacterium]